MKIVDFSDVYLRQMASIFVTEYSEPKRVWNIDTAIEYLSKNITSNPEYCKVAVTENDEFMGGICCRIDPYYSGSLLFIDSLEVDEKYRHHGVATELMKQVVGTAKQSGVDQIHFLGDNRKGFPKQWYHELGFVETGWVEYEIAVDKLHFEK
jgi:N-acetylglutamate synthase-like GNAT family acetyltransferase